MHVGACTWARLCAVHLDLQDRASMTRCLTEFTPDVVINLAALSSPAACEKSKAEAEALNAPVGLLDALAQLNADALFIQVPHPPSPLCACIRT